MDARLKKVNVVFQFHGMAGCPMSAGYAGACIHDESYRRKMKFLRDTRLKIPALV
jgi:hypothetical protein